VSAADRLVSLIFHVERTKNLGQGPVRNKKNENLHCSKLIPMQSFRGLYPQLFTLSIA